MILGVSGLAGSGKNTVCDFMAPWGAVSIALADPLKRIARDVYAFTDEQLWGPSAERNKPDTRYPREHVFGACPSTGGCATCAICGALSDGKTPVCYLTPRYCLQILGTEFGRHCYPDTWAAMCIRTAKRLLSEGNLRYDQKRGLWHVDDRRAWGDNADDTEIVTISDVRFRNEMKVIREAGGKLLRVRRPGAGLGGSAGLHPSEAEQMGIQDSEFDFVIENNGTLEDLKARTEEIVQALAR